LRHGDRLIRRGRPPLSGKPKTAIPLRPDEDVVKAYRATAEGWQTRINADLRRARKLNVRTAAPPRSAKRAPVAAQWDGLEPPTSCSTGVSWL
jgi:BrnA antitoxin of type II toxin-antitoxin system